MSQRLSALLLTVGAASCAPLGPSAPPGSPAEPAPVDAPAASSLRSAAPAAPAEKPRALPVRVEEDRFFVEPVTKDGTKVVLYTDSGGGLFLTEDAVKRLKLKLEKQKGDEGGEVDAAALPEFKPEAWIPAPGTAGGLLPVLPSDKRRASESSDGVLGQAWFKDRVWTFDYGAKQLLLRSPGDVPAHQPHREVPLGFGADAAGRRQANYPRVLVKIDGQPIDLLLDTGATLLLTDKAVAALGDKRPATRAGSFIIRSIFDGWRKKHPDWKVIEDADRVGKSTMPMIQVPAISIAGYDVGPVWFAARPDENFRKHMSQWMDKQIDGALGGSALHFFRLTVDYPRAVAIFEGI